MLRYSVPLSTSLIWANHNLHMPFQTILAFCIIFPTIHLSVFSKEIGPLAHTCTHFSGLALKICFALALLIFTNAVKRFACTHNTQQWDIV